MICISLYRFPRASLVHRIYNFHLSIENYSHYFLKYFICLLIVLPSCELLTNHFFSVAGHRGQIFENGKAFPMAKVVKQPWVWLVGVFAIMIIVGIATT